MGSFVDRPVRYPRSPLDEETARQMERDMKALFELKVKMENYTALAIAYKKRTLASLKHLLQKQENYQIAEKDVYVFKVTYTRMLKSIDQLKLDMAKIRSRKYRCYLTGELYSPY